VTIADVRLVRVEQKQDDVEPEAEYSIRFREFRKPARLKPTMAREIARVLGSDVTEDWTNQTIGIFPTQIVAYGKSMNVIAVSANKPQTAPALTGSQVDRRPIGKAAADRFLEHAKRAGKTYDDFLRHLKSNVPGGIELAFGVSVEELPRALVPQMKAFLDAAVSGPAKPEVIDRATGEVMDAKAPAAAGLVTQAELKQATDDDIPF
jgi:hypothetical protein